MKLLSSSFSPRRSPWCGLLAGTLLPALLALLPAPVCAKPHAGTVRPEIIRVESAAPANDNFANAQALSGTTGSVTGSNVGASQEASEPSFLEELGGASVWYTWTPASTVLAVFTTAGSNFDPILGAYTGNNVATLTEVATDDDFGDTLNSQITFVAHAGTTYRIAVDGYGGEMGSILLSFDSSSSTLPLITSAASETVQVGKAFTYHITATNSPTSYAAADLPTGLVVNTSTGLISGTPTATGEYNAIIGATNANGTSQASLTITVQSTAVHPAFFTGESSLSNGVYYLDFATGNYFGYYSYLTNSNYIYHFDLGYEYVFDANDGNSGVYLYDFLSQDFFYTSPGFPFPYLYDFGLKSTVYYYPDPSNYGHYNTNGVRYFYVFNTGQIISK